MRSLKPLDVRSDVSWWNPVFWMLPSQGITLASVLAAIGSFSWFMRNDVNRHLFRLPMPAWQVAGVVVVCSCVFWYLCSRRPNVFLTLLWLQLLTLISAVVAYRSWYADTPRGSPLLHASALAVGVGLLALAPRCVPAR